MAMRSLVTGVTGLLLLASCSNRATESASRATAAATPEAQAKGNATESPQARALADDLRARFRPSFVGAPALRGAEQHLTVAENGYLASTKGALASVRYPDRADARVQVTDAASGVSVQYAVIGAAAEPAEIADDLVVYRNALGPNASLLHRPTVAGDEDYVVFERAPTTARVSYRLELSDAVAGLRLVSNTLEMVDDRGQPRLRIAPPWLTGSDGRVHDATLSVEGCAVDADPGFPWDHAPTAPGARACTVHVSWQRDAVEYPALLDPAWQSTGTMATNRNEAALTACGTPTSGTASPHLVLAAGGNSVATGAALASAEVYNANLTGTGGVAGVWAAAGNLSAARSAAASIFDPSTNRIWVVGGRNGTTASGKTDTWSCSANTFSVGGAPELPPRWGHALALHSNNGAIFAVGGRTSATTMANTIARAQTGTATPFWSWVTGAARAEATAYATGGFSDTGSGGYDFCLTWMGGRSATGTVLATSGVFCATGSLSGALGPKEDTGTLTTARAGHQMVRSGSVYLLLGGTNGTSDLSSVEVFNPATFLASGKAGFSPGTPMPVARNGHIAVSPDGTNVLVAGGAGAAATTSHLFLAGLSRWEPAGPLLGSHQAPSASTFTNGIAAVPLTTPKHALLIGGTSNPERWSPRIAGAACTEAGECTTGFCVDGVCCNLACNGTCEACSNALTGAADGTCAKTKAGGSSKGLCGATAASSCGDDGTCNGAGACRKWPLGTECQAQGCATTTQQINRRTCNGLGVCLSVPNTSCSAPYVCTSLTATTDGCATSCTGTDDSKCAPGYYCNGSACVSVLAKAAVCTRDRQCTSGFCADGVCCSSRCGGSCEACTAAFKGAGADGDCGNVPADKDPRNKCAADPGYPGSCKADGSCDGSGACRAFALAGVECATPTCTAGTAAKSTCDGSGVCNLKETSCAPNTCNTTGTACAGSCAKDSECSATAYCDATTGKCAPKKANGADAKEGRECSSGILADGVCCNDACTGICEACDGAATKGTCTAVAGKGRHGDCAAGGAGEAACTASACDGKDRAACKALAGADVKCRPATCTDGVATLETPCEGTGACPTATTKPCTPFACDATACKTKCAVSADCASGFLCDVSTGICGAGSVCADDKTLKKSDGTLEPCVGGFKCQGSVCLTACSSSSECLPGFVCNTGSSKCEAAPGNTGDDGGCQVGPVGPRSGGAASTVLVLGALAAMIKRRRAR